MTAIPGTPDQVTPQWLSEVLGAPVSAAEVTPIGTGQTGATYRVAVTYSGTTDLPDSFVVKLPAQDEQVRQRVALSYFSEHAFYTQIAGTLAVPLPQCYHCALAEDGAQFVLLLADMAPGEQGDQIRGCTPAQARLAVTALAGLHGPRWCDDAWLTQTGVIMNRPDEPTARGLGEITALAVATTLERLGPRMSAQERQTILDASALVGDWLINAPDRFSLLHGDYRADNLLFDPVHERVTAVDWQTLSVGLPARDLAYFIATSLRPDDRAAQERTLVDAYHRALSVYVSDYDAESCWDDYRFGMVQVPMITALGHAYSSSTERGDDMALAMLQRGARAIRELGTLELVQDSTVR